MALDKRTRLIVILAVTVLALGGITGLVIGLQNRDNSIHLEVIPTHSSDNLIMYNARDNNSVFTWSKRIDDSLEAYRKKGSQPGAENLMICSYENGPSGKTCDVDIYKFSPCSPEYQYNYGRAAPCVFLRLNKMLNWKPEPYNRTDDLPANMPADLKQYIRIISGKPEANTVWVSCAGATPADVELMGPVQYLPRRGLPAYYFPYSAQEGYLSPLVALLFERPAAGVVITVKCTAWAKNIELDDNDETKGAAVFHLMVDV